MMRIWLWESSVPGRAVQYVSHSALNQEDYQQYKDYDFKKISYHPVVWVLLLVVIFARL